MVGFVSMLFFPLLLLQTFMFTSRPSANAPMIPPPPSGRITHSLIPSLHLTPWVWCLAATLSSLGLAECILGIRTKVPASLDNAQPTSSSLSLQTPFALVYLLAKRVYHCMCNVRKSPEPRLLLQLVLSVTTRGS